MGYIDIKDILKNNLNCSEKKIDRIVKQADSTIDKLIRHQTKVEKKLTKRLEKTFLKK